VSTIKGGEKEYRAVEVTKRGHKSYAPGLLRGVSERELQTERRQDSKNNPQPLDVGQSHSHEAIKKKRKKNCGSLDTNSDKKRNRRPKKGNIKRGRDHLNMDTTHS